MKATEVTANLEESNGSLLPGIWRDSLHVICGLTACTPGSAPGPTLGNEYGKTLPILPFLLGASLIHIPQWPVPIHGLQSLPARRYATVGTGYDPVSVCVCHKSVFCRNGWTDRAGFWHVGFFRPIIHRDIKKFRKIYMPSCDLKKGRISL